MTTQPTLTLADFLLARIAEDEAAARKAQSIYDRDVPVDSRLLGVLVVPARVLAECEAKRRIVERLVAADGGGSGDDHEDAAAYYALRGACQDLALPYADHEAFREEWRP